MKTIGILLGGYSGEYDISVSSGNVVYQNLQGQGYELFRVELKRNQWEAMDDKGHRYAISSDDFSFTLGDRKVVFDAVFNAIHGHPGEDGPLAGYFDMLRLPYSSSGQFASALTFNKAECNLLLDKYGFKTPKSVFLHAEPNVTDQQIAERLGLPCFVKPCRSGSSIGVSKVKEISQLQEAIRIALAVDHKVLVEAMVPGLELACGVSDHGGKAEALAVTHIKPAGDFFDYESKYNGLSEETTPAEISEAIYTQIMTQTEEVYRLLELKGLARIDYILDEKEQPILIEVNTIPGLSQESILPKQAKFRGIELAELFRACIDNTLS
jgi:D-alanine-D-alanine ligase